MSARAWLGLAALVSLALLATWLGRGVAAETELVLEPGRARLATLDSATRARLATFDEELTLSYYVTPRERMPSHLAHLEDDVRAGLRAVAEGVSGPVRVEVLDPDQHPELAADLASAGVAPWRSRRIEGDGYREELLWSSLRLSYGARPSVVLNGLAADQARSLQPLVLAHLEQLRAPRRPRVALSAPPGYSRLRSILQSGAEVLELDFDASPGALPAETDVLFWLGGARAGPAQLAALDALRERGGSCVVSVESLRIQESWENGGLRASFERDPDRERGGAALLAHTGLVALEGLLLDPRGAEAVGPSGEAQLVTWHVRATPDHQDFRGFVGQPNAPLYFAAPTAFALDPARLAELGLRATVLASASDGASLHALPEEPLDAAAAAALEGDPAPRAALLARLESTDSWRGARFVLADGGLLSDARLDEEPFGHGSLLRILLESLTSDESMARAQVAALQPAPLAELDETTRLWLRLLVLGAAPLLLLLMRTLRRIGTPSTHRSGASRTRFVLLRATPALLLVALLVAASGTRGLDLSRDGRNRLTDVERTTLQSYLDPIEGGVSLEVAFSPEGDLPAEQRGPARDLRRACAELSGSLDGLELRSLDPSRLDAEELSARGLRRLALTSSSDEVTTLRRAYASLVLSSEGHREVLEFGDLASYGEARFRLAFALARLARGRSTRVGLIAEPPRLSPAEAALEFQQRGLFAPSEAGAHDELVSLLERNDFELVRLGADEERPEDLDALLLLQPRRDATPQLERLSAHLAAGGRALLASQHYRVLARQLERAELELSFWPRPQFTDLDRLYLPELGATLVRELLLDTPPGSLEVQTRVDREDGTSAYVPQESTQAFFLRASPRSEHRSLFDGVGELLLPCASRIQLDPARLAQHGLRAEVLIATSPRAWSYAWSGGDLPASAHTGALDESAGVVATPESSLMVLLEGSFPRARRDESESGLASLRLDPATNTSAGRLLLLGDSEIFRDELLTLSGHAHQSFALRCVAELALSPELAVFLRRERGTPALGPLDDTTRRAWRIVVIGGAPLLLALAALLRRRLA